jgi:hypothetical protein
MPKADKIWKITLWHTHKHWVNIQRGGAVVECRPHDQEVVGSIPGQVTT